MKILLTLLLLSPLAFAEDEFPIELTCEMGANILFMHFAQKNENSWWRHHKNNLSISSKGFWADKKYFNKNNRFLEIRSLNQEKIVALIGSAFRNDLLYINRFTGKTGVGVNNGDCYEGIREYTEKKF